MRRLSRRHKSRILERPNVVVLASFLNGTALALTLQRLHEPT